MISENLQKLIDIKADIKNAINGKGGSVGERFEDYAPAIESLPSGGTEEDLGTDTIFVDHTGKIVARFSPEEIMTWTDFSAVNIPTYEGLRFVKFTHTLAEIQNGTWNDVGLCYEPIDGNTHIFVEVTAENDYISGSIVVGGQTQVNWGDGTIDVIASATTTYISHRYTAIGNYEIIIGDLLVNIQIDSISDNACFVKKIYLGSMMEGFGTTSTYYLEEMTFPVNVSKFQLHSHKQSTTEISGLKALVIDTDHISQPLPSDYNSELKVRSAKFVIAKNCKYDMFAAQGNLVSFDRKYSPITTPLHTSTSVSGTLSSLQRIYMPDGLEWTKTFSMVMLKLKGLYGNFKVKSGQSFVNYPYLEKIDSDIFFDNYTTAAPNITGLYFLKGTLKFRNLTAIGSSTFENNRMLEAIDFSEQTVVPTLSSAAIISQKSTFKLLIPDALYDTWIAATNWANVYASEPDRFIKID